MSLNQVSGGVAPEAPNAFGGQTPVCLTLSSLFEKKEKPPLLRSESFS